MVAAAAFNLDRAHSRRSISSNTPTTSASASNTVPLPALISWTTLECAHTQTYFFPLGHSFGHRLHIQFQSSFHQCGPNSDTTCRAGQFRSRRRVIVAFESRLQEAEDLEEFGDLSLPSQVEKGESSGLESMAAFQRSGSSVKLELDASATPVGPSTDLGSDSAIRNRNVMIGLLSTLLILAMSWHSLVPEDVPATMGSSKWSHGGRAIPYKEFVQKSLVGAQKFLVSDPTIDLKYHGGPLLTGTLKVHVIFYGSWTTNQKDIITDFIKSFSAPKSSTNFPTVAGWWKITRSFTNSKKTPVSQNVVLGMVVLDANYSLKKNLRESDIELLVTKNLHTIDPNFVDPTAVYLVLTAPDVAVQGFCSSQCGTHSYTRAGQKSLPFVWVGNSALTCKGWCAWPYAKAYSGAGPDVAALKSPNADPGVDGMCITIASMIVGAASNTLGNGYYQGDDANDAYEAVAACGGIYGSGAYPGYPGKLLKDNAGASYNVNGVNGRKYLVPYMFNLATKQCALQ